MSAIQSSFQRKKQKILEGLAKSENEYTDLSPKGSVDVGIRDLIEEINHLDGIVTTSSCAGRISVYLEGRKELHRQGTNFHPGEQDISSQDHQLAQGTVPGGKGAGGRWLYVSHDPLDLHTSTCTEDMHVMKLFGLSPCLPGPGTTVNKATRYVRIAFEPMILHVMTASLRHAQRVLSAAINAGFRESGVQSLRNLDDKEASPMVAVRTSGLALESVIGYLEEGQGSEDVRCIVTEEYLRIIVGLINERFEANTERILRFRKHLLQHHPGYGLRKGGREDWEDADARRQRKRAEGLQRRQELRKEREVPSAPPAIEDSDLKPWDENHISNVSCISERC